MPSTHFQSSIVTGESGAGKTENTKKVITYFAFVGSTAGIMLNSDKCDSNKIHRIRKKGERG